jgi:hypothetical protein
MAVWLVRAGKHGEQEQAALDRNVATICERHLDRASPGRPNRASQGGMTDGRSDRDASMA